MQGNRHDGGGDGNRRPQPTLTRPQKDAKLLQLAYLSADKVDYWTKIYTPIKVFSELIREPVWEVALPISEETLMNFRPHITHDWTVPMVQTNSQGTAGTVRELVEPAYNRIVTTHQHLTNFRIGSWENVMKLYGTGMRFFLCFWFYNQHLTKEQAYARARRIGANHIIMVKDYDTRKWFLKQTAMKKYYTERLSSALDHLDHITNHAGVELQKGKRHFRDDVVIADGSNPAQDLCMRFLTVRGYFAGDDDNQELREPRRTASTPDDCIQEARSWYEDFAKGKPKWANFKGLGTIKSRDEVAYYMEWRNNRPQHVIGAEAVKRSLVELSAADKLFIVSGLISRTRMTIRRFFFKYDLAAGRFVPVIRRYRRCLKWSRIRRQWRAMKVRWSAMKVICVFTNKTIPQRRIAKRLMRDRVPRQNMNAVDHLGVYWNPATQCYNWNFDMARLTPFHTALEASTSSIASHPDHDVSQWNTQLQASYAALESLKHGIGKNLPSLLKDFRSSLTAESIAKQQFLDKIEDPQVEHCMACDLKVPCSNHSSCRTCKKTLHVECGVTPFVFEDTQWCKGCADTAGITPPLFDGTKTVAGGQEWTKTMAKQYFTMVHFIDQALAEKVVEGFHTHSLPKFAASQVTDGAARAAIGMGLHNLNTMGTTRKHVAKTLNVAIPRHHLPLCVRYLECCYNLITSWNIEDASSVIKMDVLMGCIRQQERIQLIGTLGKIHLIHGTKRNEEDQGGEDDYSYLRSIYQIKHNNKTPHPDRHGSRKRKKTGETTSE